MLNRKSGLPKTRLHDLRAAHASMLADRGVHQRVAMERLRHSSSDGTTEIYQQASEKMHREAVDRIKQPPLTRRETLFSSAGSWRNCLSIQVWMSMRSASPVWIAAAFHSSMTCMSRRLAKGQAVSLRSRRTA